MLRLLLLRWHRSCLLRERDRCYQQIEGARSLLSQNTVELQRVEAELATARWEREYGVGR